MIKLKICEVLLIIIHYFLALNVRH